MQIREIVNSVIADVGIEFKELDSFGMIDFLVLLESKIEKETGMRINFVDEMSGGLLKNLNDVIKFAEIKTSKKLVIVDLDNTMWDGIVGDIGVENIIPNIELQKSLLKLKNNGMLLAISSKNEEGIAIEAINNHPDMILRMADFVSYRINWKDKASNIIEIVNELNIGVNSVVFIDDSKFERVLVNELLPEVLVLDWPIPLGFGWMYQSQVSDEDINRTRLYKDEFKRQKAMINIPYDEWLKSLEIKITLGDVNQGNIKRVCQLLNKSNQMNLTTRRLNESELLSWIKTNKMWAVTVSDRFGDAGLTGIISLAHNKIIDFVLSCRVMGREIENTMIETVINYAREIGLKEIVAEYIPTSKNKPCYDFLMKSASKNGNTFTWSVNG